MLEFIVFIGRNQRKNAAMLDSDDTDSVSSSSTMRSEQMLGTGGEELQTDKESVLDQSLDALFEKRYFLSLKFRTINLRSIKRFSW